MQKLEYIVVVSIFLSTISCTTDKFEIDPCSDVSYLHTIKPLVNLKCATNGCHISGFLPGDFTNYEVLKKKVSEGKIQSLVFDLSIMPPGDKLTESELSVLECWINNGAKSN